MRVLVTGGTGLIGARLCQLLKKDQHEIIVLSRDPQAKAARLPDGVQVHAWDGCTPDGWYHLIDADTAIVNLAGDYQWLDPAPPPCGWTYTVVAYYAYPGGDSGETDGSEPYSLVACP